MPKKLQDEESLRIFNQLALLRNMNGLTQKRLAKEANVAYNTISHMETGVYTPSLETINRVCKVLGCELSITFNTNKLIAKRKIKNGDYEKELFGTSIDDLPTSGHGGFTGTRKPRLRRYIRKT